MFKTLKYISLFVFTLAQVLAYGQVEEQIQQDTAKQSNSVMKIYSVDTYEMRGDLDPIEEHYNGNVKMSHDSVFMFSDTSIVSQNYLNSTGDVIIIQDDTIRLFSDSLYYDIDEGKAQLFYNVVLENGKQQLFTEKLDYYKDSKIAVYPDTALLVNDRTKLSSLRGKYDVNAALATFVGEVIVIDEEFSLTSDSLQYNTDIDKAIFVSPTNIVQGDRKIYCESGYYDIPNGQALFEQNASYIEGDQEASAHQIRYNESSGEITLTGNAKYKDAEKNASADKMVYDEKTKDIHLIGNAVFFDGESTATGAEIKYNEDTEEVSIIGNAILDSEDTSINAETFDFDDKTGKAIIKDNVVFVSKKDSVSVYSDVLEVDSENDSYVASGESRPYMLRFIDGDSLFLSGDTLHVEKRIDSLLDTANVFIALDTVNIFKSYYDVRILSEEFQAIADSMYYDSKDSLFTLYDQPTMWSDSMQFTADTIKIRLAEEGIEKVYLNGNGMIIELIGDDYYNQLKAKFIEASIDSGEISFMEMQQNAESNYYIMDDEDAFVGLNHTLCNRMTFFFEEGEMSDIKFFEQAESKLTPMQMLLREQLFLDNFNWNLELKPNSLEDLLKAKEIIEISAPIDSLALKDSEVDGVKDASVEEKNSKTVKASNEDKDQNSQKAKGDKVQATTDNLIEEKSSQNKENIEAELNNDKSGKESRKEKRNNRKNKKKSGGE